MQVASDELSRMWSEQADILREFLERRPSYEHLCAEVEYILQKRLRDEHIVFAAVSSRAKTLRGFAEKVFRKGYLAPLTEVTDIAGARVVYLYKSDQAKIEAVIEKEFEIVERVDKVESREANEFGYGALHFLVRLGKRSSGARHDDLKDLVCEIQVRTVLQDAWAIIDHHLSYKQEGDVPRELLRRLNALSGLFLTADDQFVAIREERNAYVSGIKDLAPTKSVFLTQELNLDTLTAYLGWKFPRLKQDAPDPLLRRILRVAQESGMSTLADVNSAVERTKKARAAIAREARPTAAVTQVNRALALLIPTYAERSFPAEVRARFTKYRHMTIKGAKK